MGLENLNAGRDVPNDINVVIEIPAGSHPIKYEVDKTTGMLYVDRFVETCMYYPCNYGFIPQTLSEDGDPVDILVAGVQALLPGSIIRCRPIGVLRMTDESGVDAKILSVPIDKVSPRFRRINEPTDLGEEFILSIEHFFQHYKDLEKGKWVRLAGWEDTTAAKAEIMASIDRYQKK